MSLKYYPDLLQLAGFIAIWLVLLVILFIGPLFEQLPNVSSNSKTM